MSKNQPRDGNGKFAKMIRVEDKYGNSAYFTPEELEGFGKKKEEKNPDCEPATKGYVKCLLRKTWNHTHEPYGDCRLLEASTIFGWVITVCAFRHFLLYHVSGLFGSSSSVSSICT